jgi:hypothetical protein
MASMIFYSVFDPTTKDLVLVPDQHDTLKILFTDPNYLTIFDNIVKITIEPITDSTIK